MIGLTKQNAKCARFRKIWSRRLGKVNRGFERQGTGGIRDRKDGRTDGRSGGERRRGWDEQEVVGGAVQMFSKVDRAGSISQEVALVHQQPASMPEQLINNRQQV